jgi:fumarate reductase subunit C
MTNSNVFTFFLIGTLAFALLAFRFVSGKNYAFKMFGTGLALLALAFATWSVIILTNPSDLTTITTLGVIPFGLANIFFVAAGTSDFKPATRRNLLIVATVVIGALFVIRTFITPSKPMIDAQGFFSFNADPIAIIMYVIVFAGALMPAVHVVTSHLASVRDAMFTRLFFNGVTLSGVVLLVSTSDDLQYLNGYVMLIGLIGLVVTHIRKNPEFITR